jgi:hypothetical protein
MAAAWLPPMQLRASFGAGRPAAAAHRHNTAGTHRCTALRGSLLAVEQWSEGHREGQKAAGEEHR